MESSSRKQELLRQYVEQTLQGNDLAEFRLLAQTDAQFRREAELERRLSQAFRQGQQEQVRKMLDRYHDNDFVTREKQTSGRLIRGVPMQWVAAASVVAILALGVVVWQTTGESSVAEQGQTVTIPQLTSVPVFGFSGADSVQSSTTTIVIYSERASTAQYSFRQDTLRLYGDVFAPDALTLLIGQASDGTATYQLQTRQDKYPLTRSKTEKSDLKSQKVLDKQTGKK